jgi:MoxR-like ATPase
MDRDVENMTARYINLQALGKAIALTNENEANSESYLKGGHQQPKSSVVLIDEIDKAPRDFPNDILNQIENYEFEIKEDANRKITKGKSQNIVVIMTSNSERNLPDAFLRRCVFYHIPFPDQDQLLDIAKQHLGSKSDYANATLIECFLKLRNRIKEKKPATAELIAWLKILEVQDFLNSKDFSFDGLTEKQKHVLKYSYSVLIKTSEDFSKIS